MHWKMCEAKGRCEDYYGRVNELKIIKRNVVRRELWIKRLQNPVSALTEALRMTEELEEADPSTAGGTWTVSGSSAAAEPCEWPLLLSGRVVCCSMWVANCSNFSSCAERWPCVVRFSDPQLFASWWEREWEWSLRHPSWGDALVRRSCTGLVTWFPLTECPRLKAHCKWKWILIACRQAVEDDQARMTGGQHPEGCGRGW